MPDSTRRRFWQVIFPAFLFIGMVCAQSIRAQQEVPLDLISDSLRIVSPADGTIVTPGETVTVAVEAPPGAFSHVGVIGENIGWSEAKASPPYEFSLVIPNNIIGPKKLTAIGIIRPGEGLFSHSVTINIESPVALTGLSVEPAQLNFRFLGQQTRLLITGVFSNGTTLDITKSTGTGFSSQNSGVAEVDATGLVTAVGSGTTNIIVSFGPQSFVVPVSVPKTIRGDFNADGNVDRYDLDEILDFLGLLVTDDWTNIPESKAKPATGPFDARDLNGDEVVNAEDVRIMVGLIGALADLSITLSASPNPVTVGSQVAYTLTVVNTGPNAAPYVSVRGLLPKSQFISSSLKQCAALYDQASCNFASLESGQSITATIVTVPSEAGTFSGLLRVGSGVPDPVVANDRARVDVNVVTAQAPTGPGRMSGDGHIDAGGKRYHFEFNIRESSSGKERGRLELRVQEHRPARNRGSDDERSRRIDRFVSTDITRVVFSDSPSITPGRRSQPTVDTVEFRGSGRWNRNPGYTFEARATDAGEPGTGRDTFTVTIKDQSGKAVEAVIGTLSGGNIQSFKMRH